MKKTITILPDKIAEYERVLDIHYKQKSEYRKANDMTEYELENAYYEGLMDALYILTNVTIERKHHVGESSSKHTIKIF